MTDIPGLSVLVGANGTGKSTLFDAFGFLRDSLADNVRAALGKRGGFREVVSRESNGPITIEIKFREASGPLVTYHLAVGIDGANPVVEREYLQYRRGQHGRPWRFLDFQRGKGLAITNEVEYATKPDAEMQREEQELASPDILAIKGLGQFQRFPVVSAFREIIENWHVSDFQIQDARPSQEIGYHEHLSPRGDNLPQVTQYLFEHHRSRFDAILQRMAERVPGVERVEAAETVDGRIVLRFQDGSFQDPFVARFVSDGTIKMFAYLVLLNDPNPHALLCVEEPENQLYPQLLLELAEEFRSYAQRGGQVFVSTHSPDFLNGVLLDEIFWFEKRQGFAHIYRARDIDVLRALVEEGDFPGALWKQGLFESLIPNGATSIPA
jgi:predicted ATPase